MLNNNKVFWYFCVAGFIGGSIGSIVLLSLFGLDSSYPIFGFRSPLVYLTFPVIGGIVAGTISVVLNGNGFGSSRGAGVGFLSFIAFCLLLSLFSPAGILYFFPVFLSYILFGFIFVGWVMVLIGWLTGLCIFRIEK